MFEHAKLLRIGTDRLIQTAKQSRIDAALLILKKASTEYFNATISFRSTLRYGPGSTVVLLRRQRPRPPYDARHPRQRRSIFLYAYACPAQQRK